jgi:hypothetical protein
VIARGASKLDRERIQQDLKILTGRQYGTLMEDKRFGGRRRCQDSAGISQSSLNCNDHDHRRAWICGLARLVARSMKIGCDRIVVA